MLKLRHTFWFLVKILGVSGNHARRWGCGALVFDLRHASTFDQIEVYVQIA